MLFRIQTIWLLLAGITLGLVFVLDIYRYADGREVNILSQYINTIVAAVNAALIVFTIFKYKNLKSQKGFVWMSVLLNIILLVLLFLNISAGDAETQATALAGSPTLSTSYQPAGRYLLGAFAPAASIIFLILAARHIGKDQKVIKDAYQRLR